MAFLAIDGSTKSTGYAVFEDGKLINYGHKTAASTDLIRRIMVMRECIRELLTNYKVDTVIMEEVRPDRGASNPITMKALMWL